MKQPTLRYLFFLIGLCLSAELFSQLATDGYGNTHEPVAENGVIDLSEVNFEDGSLIELKGEWDFYWKQLRSPEEFSRGKILPDGTIKFPGTWQRFRSKEGGLPRIGYATYRLRISHHHANEVLALYIPTAFSSYRLFLDNKLIANNGIPGTDKTSSVPGEKPETVSVVIPENDFYLTLQIANFHNYIIGGGAKESIIVGSQNAVKSDQAKHLILRVILLGALLFSGIYHLGFYFLNRKDPSALYFGVLCVNMAIWMIFQRGQVYGYFSDSWFFKEKVELIALALIGPSLLKFFQSVYPIEIEKRILRFVFGMHLIYAVVVLLTSSYVFHRFLLTIQISTVFLVCYGFFILVLASIRKREGALVFLIGFAVCPFMAINDFLFFKGLLQTGAYAPAGLLIFVLSQSFVLPRRYARAFTNIQELVNQKTRELQSANEEISKQYQFFKAHNRDLTSLSQIGAKVISTLSTETIVEEVYSRLNELMPADSFAFGIFNAEKRRLEFIGPQVNGARMPSYCFNVDHDFNALAVKSFLDNKALLSNDLVEQFLSYPNAIGQSPESVIHVPLNHQSETIGVISVSSFEKNAFTDYHVSLLQNLAVFISIAIENAKTFDTLDQSFAQLKELDEYKESMTGMIVHDFKNSLNTVINFSEGKPTERRMNSIRQAGQFMLNMVMNILDVQKFEETSPKLSLANYSMSSLVKDAVDQLTYMMEQKSISLELQQDIRFQVRVDHDLFVRVIVNILSNAIKYSPHNGSILLSISQENDNVKVCIKDQGPGIPNEMLDKIFDKYAQVEARKEGTARSTGLGLTFCRMVVEAHSGTISVTSKEGSGSRFCIKIPVLEEMVSKEPAEVVSFQPETRFHLSEEDRVFLQPYLQELRQWEVYDYSDVVDVLEKIETDYEDLLTWKQAMYKAIQNGNEQLFKTLTS